VLVNITGGTSLTIHEVNEAASFIRDAAHEDVEIIFGSVIDSDLDDEIIATVIATGFEEKPAAAMTSYNKWRPAGDVSSLRGSNKILAKTLTPDNGDGDLDIPTFMRKPEIGKEGDL
jgi:cell division protein FtsZ